MAEAAFAEAVSLQTVEARCEWNDASRLLDSAARASYSAIPCAARANIDAWLWWLADPLWTEQGNERWLEQQMRRMLVAFRQQIGRDERFDWRREAGGDALADLVMRYGWPTYLHWNGAGEDAVRSAYLNAHGSPTNAPYTTFEYSPGRIHAIPSWRAITQPLAATVTDWELRPPSGAMEHAGAELVWWPVEHFEAVRPLVQLGPIEVAFLRREREVILAVAGDLDTAAIGRARGDSVYGHLVLSEAPDDVRRIGELRGVSSRTLVGRGTTQPGNSLLSVEIPSHGNAPAARSRFAISAPATLGLAPNAYGISDPIVLRVPENGDSLPNEMEEALEHMAPLARFADSQIGVYFETYGLTPSDTAELAVWIERYTPQGVLRVLGNTLGITTDLNTPTAISWIGTAVNAAHQVDGSTHILGRTVVLDLSELVPGEYWLDVAVAKPGGPTVRGRQRIEVQ